MARRVLGNDPFLRGAPVRQPAAEAEDPIPARPKLPPVLGARRPREVAPVRRTRARPTPQRKKPAPKAATKPAPKPTEVVETQTKPRVDVVAVEDAAHVAKDAVVKAVETVLEQTDPVTLLTETIGVRLRYLFERQVPALLEGLARSSVDALGLTAQPVAVSDVDPFGLSREFVDRWQPVLARVLESYFRVEVGGLERIPTDGPAILVCNHSGVLPYDEVLLSVAVRAGTQGPGSESGVDVRPLSEDFAINAPFAGSWLNRFGLVRASQDNAERLLGARAVVAVFPEGSQGIGKLYRNRYRLQRFGRGGFVRLALRTQVPVIPVALIGGEESQPVMARVRLPRPLKISHLPLTPTFPWLGPLGLLPLPSRWRIEVGEPLQWNHSVDDANNRPLVASLTEDVRQTLQVMLDGLVRKRRAVFL